MIIRRLLKDSSHLRDESTRAMNYVAKLSFFRNFGVNVCKSVLRLHTFLDDSAQLPDLTQVNHDFHP